MTLFDPAVFDPHPVCGHCGRHARPVKCPACARGEHFDCRGRHVWDRANPNLEPDPTYCTCDHTEPRRSNR